MPTASDAHPILPFELALAGVAAAPAPPPVRLPVPALPPLRCASPFQDQHTELRALPEGGVQQCCVQCFNIVWGFWLEC
eukprot:1149945-Pelagomonas_calceolata.AAC.10